jgi:hypothetical protein
MSASNQPDREPTDSAQKTPEPARPKKSFILHTDPFTVFQVVLFTMMIVLFCVVVPLLQTISEWLRQP